MQAAGLDLQTMSSLSSSGSMLFDMQDTWDLERRAPYFLRTPTKRVKRSRSRGSEEEDGYSEYGEEEEALEAEFDRDLEKQMQVLQRQAKRMRAENGILLHAQQHLDRQESTAKLEHARLRQLIKALLTYKEDLVIRLPTAAERPAGGGGDDEPGGPFRVCLEEDPAEAFLNFDEDVGKGAAAQPVPTGCQRRIHSAPAQTTGVRLDDRPPGDRQDPSSAGYEAMAAASLAWNNGNPAAAFLDLIHLACSQGTANPAPAPPTSAPEPPPPQGAQPTACRSV